MLALAAEGAIEGVLFLSHSVLSTAVRGHAPGHADRPKAFNEHWNHADLALHQAHEPHEA
jgi:hypothetical protein